MIRYWWAIGYWEAVPIELPLWLTVLLLMPVMVDMVGLLFDDDSCWWLCHCRWRYGDDTRLPLTVVVTHLSTIRVRYLIPLLVDWWAVDLVLNYGCLTYDYRFIYSDVTLLLRYYYIRYDCCWLLIHCYIGELRWWPPDRPFVHSLFVTIQYDAVDCCSDLLSVEPLLLTTIRRSVVDAVGDLIPTRPLHYGMEGGIVVVVGAVTGLFCYIWMQNCSVGIYCLIPCYCGDVVVLWWWRYSVLYDRCYAFRYSEWIRYRWCDDSVTGITATVDPIVHDYYRVPDSYIVTFYIRFWAAAFVTVLSFECNSIGVHYCCYSDLLLFVLICYSVELRCDTFACHSIPVILMKLRCWTVTVRPCVVEPSGGITFICYLLRCVEHYRSAYTFTIPIVVWKLPVYLLTLFPIYRCWLLLYLLLMLFYSVFVLPLLFVVFHSSLLLNYSLWLLVFVIFCRWSILIDCLVIDATNHLLPVIGGRCDSLLPFGISGTVGVDWWNTLFHCALFILAVLTADLHYVHCLPLLPIWSIDAFYCGDCHCVEWAITIRWRYLIWVPFIDYWWVTLILMLSLVITILWRMNSRFLSFDACRFIEDCTLLLPLFCYCLVLLLIAVQCAAAVLFGICIVDFAVGDDAIACSGDTWWATWRPFRFCISLVLNGDDLLHCRFPAGTVRRPVFLVFIYFVHTDLIWGNYMTACGRPIRFSWPLPVLPLRCWKFNAYDSLFCCIPTAVDLCSYSVDYDTLLEITFIFLVFIILRWCLNLLFVLAVPGTFPLPIRFLWCAWIVPVVYSSFDVMILNGGDWHSTVSLCGIVTYILPIGCYCSHCYLLLVMIHCLCCLLWWKLPRSYVAVRSWFYVIRLLYIITGRYRHYSISVLIWYRSLLPHSATTVTITVVGERYVVPSLLFCITVFYKYSAGGRRLITIAIHDANFTITCIRSHLITTGDCLRWVIQFFCYILPLFCSTVKLPVVVAGIYVVRYCSFVELFDTVHWCCRLFDGGGTLLFISFDYRLFITELYLFTCVVDWFCLCCCWFYSIYIFHLLFWCWLCWNYVSNSVDRCCLPFFYRYLLVVLPFGVCILRSRLR